MIVNSYGDHLLCMLLPYYILIKFCLDLVRCGDRFDIELFFNFLILRFFLFNLLPLKAHAAKQIRKIDHTDILYVRFFTVIFFTVFIVFLILVLLCQHNLRRHAHIHHILI